MELLDFLVCPRHVGLGLRPQRRHVVTEGLGLRPDTFGLLLSPFPDVVGPFSGLRQRRARLGPHGVRLGARLLEDRSRPGLPLGHLRLGLLQRPFGFVTGLGRLGPEVFGGDPSRLPGRVGSLLALGSGLLGVALGLFPDRRGGGPDLGRLGLGAGPGLLRLGLGGCDDSLPLRLGSLPGVLDQLLRLGGALLAQGIEFGELSLALLDLLAGRLGVSLEPGDLRLRLGLDHLRLDTADVEFPRRPRRLGLDLPLQRVRVGADPRGIGLGAGPDRGGLGAGRLAKVLQVLGFRQPGLDVGDEDLGLLVRAGDDLAGLATGLLGVAGLVHRLRGGSAAFLLE